MSTVEQKMGDEFESGAAAAGGEPAGRAERDGGGSPEVLGLEGLPPELRDRLGDELIDLRNAGLIGAGMPEAGSLALPRRFAAAGVKDMVRVSDARMSGTAFGTVALHCSPEAAVGGPIGLVHDGDLIQLDAPPVASTSSAST